MGTINESKELTQYNVDLLSFEKVIYPIAWKTINYNEIIKSVYFYSFLNLFHI